MPDRPVAVPDVMQPPAPCPACGAPDRLFTPNARRTPYSREVLYEPAWQCTRCGQLDFIAPPEGDASVERGAAPTTSHPPRTP